MCVNIILQPKKPFLFLENYYDTTNYKMIIKRISARPCDLTRCYVIYVYAYAVKKFSSACELFYLILYVGCHIMLLYNAVCIIFVLRTTPLHTYVLGLFSPPSSCRPDEAVRVLLNVAI